MSFDFRPLFWFYGVLGGVLGLVGAAGVLGIIAVLRDHWR